jgi:signal transduction histidine kinase
LKKKKAKKTKRPNHATPAAVLEERRRISRELHDRVLQLLSSVRLRAEACRRDFLNNPVALSAELENIENTTDKAIIEIRNLLAENLRSGEVTAGSLERRLKEELEIFRSRTGFKLDFRCAINARNLPNEIERELYFTLREAVLNAVRHSRATELHLSLDQTNTTCKAVLKDNGVGFEVSAAEGSSHYGIRGMKERIQKVGGKISIQTEPGKGTEIAIAIPLPQTSS